MLTISGKTVLCAQMTRLIRKNPTNEAIVCFCSIHRDSPTAFNGILRSLVGQLIAIESTTASIILDTYASQGKSPTNENLEHILNLQFQSSPSAVLVIDGLDEINDKVQQRLVMELLADLSARLGRPVKTLFSSRSTAQLEQYLGKRPFLRLEDFPEHTKACIESNVRSRIECLSLLGADFQEQVTEEILNKSEGWSEFLWPWLLRF